MENAGGVAIIVTRTSGSNGELSVGYTTIKGSATEGAIYTFSSGSTTFAAGDAVTKTFTAPIINDKGAESDETVKFSLSNPFGKTMLGAPSTAVSRITMTTSGRRTCAGVTATIVDTDNNDTLQGTSGPRRHPG
jgi:hypothetical protein